MLLHDIGISMTVAEISSLVDTISIYRKRNGIKLAVIPRYEESPKVLFMFVSIIPDPRGRISYVMTATYPLSRVTINLRKFIPTK